MSIAFPIPTTVAFTNANLSTESARRDNAQRETIPQTSGLENSAAEQGLGSESDRVKTAGQQPQPVTYERPQANQNASSQAQPDGANKDNADDPSAGKENAQGRQQQQQDQAEAKKVEELKARDQEVRAHEQAHASVGGQYAGAPSYEFETGPDGRRYAVGGEVQIDISNERTPEETLRKMQQVRAAALAPAEPSPQDLRVASEATQKAMHARAEIAKQQSTESQSSFEQVFPPSSLFDNSDQQAQKANGFAQNSPVAEVPDLDEIVQGVSGSGIPTRRLSEETDGVAESVGLASDADQFKQRLANREKSVVLAENVIRNFYQNIDQSTASGFQLRA